MIDMISMFEYHTAVKIESKPQIFGTVTVGERGQVAIPQEAREQYNIQPGDKLLVISGLFGGVALVPQDVVSSALQGIFAEGLKALETPAKASTK
jgi:AbrB family looped-hinge helix DNA binding protein